MKRWTPADKATLRTMLAAGAPTADIVAATGRTANAIQNKAAELGLSRACVAWSPEEESVLASNWGAMGIKCAPMLPRRTKGAIKQHAADMGLSMQARSVGRPAKTPEERAASRRAWERKRGARRKAERAAAKPFRRVPDKPSRPPDSIIPKLLRQWGRPQELRTHNIGWWPA